MLHLPGVSPSGHYPVVLPPGAGTSFSRRSSRDDPSNVWVWNNIKARDKMRRKSTSNIAPPFAASFTLNTLDKRSR